MQHFVSLQAGSTVYGAPNTAINEHPVHIMRTAFCASRSHGDDNSLRNAKLDRNGGSLKQRGAVREEGKKKRKNKNEKEERTIREFKNTKEEEREGKKIARESETASG